MDSNIGIDFNEILWLIGPLTIAVLLLVFSIKAYRASRAQGWNLIVIAAIINLIDIGMNKVLYWSDLLNDFNLFDSDFYTPLSYVNFVLFITVSILTILGFNNLATREKERNRATYMMNNPYNQAPPPPMHVPPSDNM